MPERLRLLHGDCLELLKTLEPDTIDSLVTDPPAGIGFMGKDWDSDKGGRAEWIAWLSLVMRECLRVLKPGAHGLVWALPRTSHWTACALEDAGFEIRDCVYHVFGQGFPKSLDISKAIDKAAGVEREVVATRKHSGSNTQGVREAYDHGDYVYSAPATPEARQWSGFGTALKPAVECWWLVRKPLGEKTVAANVLKHGTGGLNIDGGRIGTARMGGQTVRSSYSGSGGHFGGGNDRDKEFVAKVATGRFPSHLLLSHSPECTDEACIAECAVKMLDEQSGPCRTGIPTKGSEPTTKNDFGKYLNRSLTGYGDSGGASRFFYTAKISASERGDSTHPTMKTQKLMRYLVKLITPPGGMVLDPFMGSGSTGLAALSEGFRFIGIEREAEYHAIAAERIHHGMRREKKQIELPLEA